MTRLRMALAIVAVLALVAIAVEGYFVAKESRRQTCVAQAAATTRTKTTSTWGNVGRVGAHC
jgi:hypothetical protein